VDVCGLMCAPPSPGEGFTAQYMRINQELKRVPATGSFVLSMTVPGCPIPQLFPQSLTLLKQGALSAPQVRKEAARS
jgi:hypothetical protein